MQLQRLNMDNSWLLTFGGKRILIDPWLQGKEVDFFSWFNTQWHKTKPVSVKDVGEFDVVLITQKYPDHFHPETLLALQPKQLIVPQSIEKKVSALLPQAKVTCFNQKIEKLHGSELNIHFLPTSRKLDPIYDALILENGKQCVLIATHGITELSKWKDFFAELPPIQLAFTPFNRYQLPFWLGGTVAPGLDAVKELITQINPNKIVATHDEDKHASGLVHKFASITFSPSASELKKDPLFADRLLHLPDYQVIEI